MDLIIESQRLARWGVHSFPCAIGKNGVIDAQLKREGDKKTPVGQWPIRQVFFRSDRLALPPTNFPIRALQKDDGWCENPDDPHYNQLIKVKHVPGEDQLWREDNLYDILVVLGHNDSPVRPGLGSAIFLHVARPDYSPSAGCVTLAQSDLLTVLREAQPHSCVTVKPNL